MLFMGRLDSNPLTERSAPPNVWRGFCRKYSFNKEEAFPVFLKVLHII